MLMAVAAEKGRLFVDYWSEIRPRIILTNRGNWQVEGQDGEWDIGSGVRTTSHPEDREYPEGAIFVFESCNDKQTRIAMELLESKAVPAP